MEEKYDLRYAVKDAEDLRAQFILLGVPEENITILTSNSRGAKCANKKNIEAAFKEFTANLKEGDNAFVFLSGNGFHYYEGSGRTLRAIDYYTPKDIDPDSMQETAVSIDDMASKLKWSSATFKWMVVDACRVEINSRPPMEAEYGRIMVPQRESYDFVLVKGCKVGQYTFESPEIEQGLLTYALLEALCLDDNKADKNKDGVLKLGEIISYVRTRTEELAKECQNKDERPMEQTPEATMPHALKDVTILTNLSYSAPTDAQTTKPDDAEQTRKRNQADEYFKEAQTALKAKEYAAATTYLDEALQLYEAPEYLAFRNGALTVAVKAAVTQAIVDGELQKAKSLNALLAELDEKAAKANEVKIKQMEQTPASKPSVSGASGLTAGELKTLTIAGVKVNFHWAPAGRFMMGSPESEENRFNYETQHEVELTQGFWIAETETTQELWEAVMGNNPSEFKGSAQLPVDSISWNDCRGFVDKLNSSYSSVLPIGYKYAMPTEAQWEYACRSGTTTPFNFGSTLNGDKANCYGYSPYGTSTKGEYKGKTTPVKSYAPNAWGLYDMHGNVEEWCADWDGHDYYTSSDVVKDPTGPSSGSLRVLRGGSWNCRAEYCRSAYQGRREPDYRYESKGFRLVLVR